MFDFLTCVGDDFPVCFLYIDTYIDSPEPITTKIIYVAKGVMLKCKIRVVISSSYDKTCNKSPRCDIPQSRCAGK